MIFFVIAAEDFLKLTYIYIFFKSSLNDVTTFKSKWTSLCKITANFNYIDVGFISPRCYNKVLLFKKEWGTGLVIWQQKIGRVTEDIWNNLYAITRGDLDIRFIIIVL